MFRPVRALIMPLLLIGCAGGGGGPYPSLAPRPGEKIGFDEPTVTTPALVADPALDEQIAAWLKAFDAQAAGFDAAASVARKRAAARLTVGSDAWLDAQAALAKLDDWRTRTTATNAEVDAAASSRAARLLPAYPALETLRQRGDAEAARQATIASEIQAATPAA